MQPGSSRSGWSPARFALVAIALSMLTWACGSTGPTPRSTGTTTTATPQATSTPRPARPTPTPRFAAQPPADWSGDTIPYAELPPEALDTLAVIGAGGPYPYDQDDGAFGNREGLLPDRPSGSYRECTVETPGSPDRGARRLVVGDGRDVYYTDDHYESFRFVVP
jgi:ribonuclease T1